MGRGQGGQSRRGAAPQARPLSAEVGTGELPRLAGHPELAKPLGEVLAALNPALRAGSIPNPRYQELRRAFASLVEDAYRLLIAEPYLNKGRYRTQPPALVAAIDSFYQASQIGSTARAVGKVPGDYPLKTDLLALFAELARLKAAVDCLRNRVVKRTPPVGAEPDYSPPPPTALAERQVTAALTRLTDSIKAEYAEQVFVSYAELLQAFDRADRTQRARLDDNPTLRHLLRVKGLFGHDCIRGYANLQPGWEELVRAEAECAANRMQAAFLVKNVRKLAKILELKGNTEGEGEVLRAATGRGVFEGDIRFRFADGSSFVVRNKIVHGVNQFGTHYDQFPTTFHAATLPDGSALADPSEERMIEVFARA